MARIFIAMNGKRINTLDDLKDNFNSSQMISFYRGGRLQKWLEEIGASEELESIQSFEEGYDDDTLLSMLMAVFELSDEQIAKATPTQPEPVAEEVPVENAVTADEKTTDVQGKQSPAITAGCSWQICQLGAKDDNGEILATCQDISDAELATSKLISGPKQHYNLSRAFFFDGYFWAQVLIEKNNLHSDSLWAKSSDCVHWELDTKLNKMLKDSVFTIRRIKVCDKHVFMLSGENGFIAYSSQTGWIHKELDMDGIISTVEYESDLEDIFEGNGYAGIIGVRRWETGVFKKESNYDHQIHVCQDLIESESSDFSELCGYSNYVCDDPKTYVFKDYLFVTSDDEDNEFQFAALDAQSPEFHPVELQDGMTVSGENEIYAFKDAMFIIREKMIFTTDGLEWKKCQIDSDRILAVVDSGNGYLAIAEGKKKGTSVLFKSDSGEIWEKIQNFCFSIENSERRQTSLFVGIVDSLLGNHAQNIAVAGNNMLLIFNGSTSGKYILVNTSML